MTDCYRLNSTGFLNHATAPIRHDDTLDRNRNRIENTTADSLGRSRTANMLINVASRVPIPETDTGFAALQRAQALGDEQALRERGRRVIRVHLGWVPDEGLEVLADALS